MASTKAYSREQYRNPINTILAIILAIETIFVAGLLGYRLGETKGMSAVQPIYNITLQVDPSMIEHVEQDGAEVEADINPTETETEIKEDVVADYLEPVITHTYTEEDITYLAKTVYGEARGLSKTEQSAVVWTILNRVDSNKFNQNTIIGVVTAPNQFAGYKSSHPVNPDIRELVV